MGNIWRSFWYAAIIILLSAVCSCQGDINSRNLLLNSRYTTPPKIAYMKNRIQKSISVLSYPKEFNGTKLSFLQDNDFTEE